MPTTPVKSVVISPDEEARFLRRLEKLRDQIRMRAYEVYRRRFSRGSAKEDWLQAEREVTLCPLAGIEDNDRAIRITAAVPDIDACHLILNVVPGSIVVEGKAATSPLERYSVFPLHEAIKPAEVRAELSNGDLTIVAPKANPTE